MSEVKQISMVKGDHQFIFRYRLGEENKLIEHFQALASENGNGFDWFDAAIMSYQMGVRVVSELGMKDE